MRRGCRLSRWSCRCGSLREDDVLCWQLFVTAHHVSGMVQGEFTETEYFEVESPFGKPDEMVCRTVDIVRKTRFAIAERHLRHLPHQTYPAVDGKQGLMDIRKHCRLDEEKPPGISAAAMWYNGADDW